MESCHSALDASQGARCLQAGQVVAVLTAVATIGSAKLMGQSYLAYRAGNLAVGEALAINNSTSEFLASQTVPWTKRHGSLSGLQLASHNSFSL